MIFERLSFEKLFGVRRKSETTIVVSGKQVTGVPSRSVVRWIKRPGDMFRDHKSLINLELEVKHRNSLINLDF